MHFGHRTGSHDESDNALGTARQLGGSEIYAAILTPFQSRLYQDPGPLQRFKLGKSHAGGSVPESRAFEFEGNHTSAFTCVTGLKYEDPAA